MRRNNSLEVKKCSLFFGKKIRGKCCWFWIKGAKNHSNHIYEGVLKAFNGVNMLPVFLYHCNRRVHLRHFLILMHILNTKSKYCCFSFSDFLTDFRPKLIPEQCITTIAPQTVNCLFKSMCTSLITTLVKRAKLFLSLELFVFSRLANRLASINNIASMFWVWRNYCSWCLKSLCWISWYFLLQKLKS